MRLIKTNKRIEMAALALLLVAGDFAPRILAQGAPPPYGPPPPYFSPPQLDSLVSRIALYPDSLLSQVLAAATFSDQIPDAARWADQHHYLTGDALAAAIEADRLPWDPSVQALLPFPAVLDMMASDMNWTRQLGDAFLSNGGAVMDSVQRMRHSTSVTRRGAARTAVGISCWLPATGR